MLKRKDFLKGYTIIEVVVLALIAGMFLVMTIPITNTKVQDNMKVNNSSAQFTEKTGNFTVKDANLKVKDPRFKGFR
jgi:competence protein ComGC